jgi:zinc/manganese transport system substrate-binding protein
MINPLNGSWRPIRGVVALALSGCVALAGDGLPRPAVAAGASAPQPIRVVAAENFYANVAAQIGGRYVSTLGIMNNPQVDPHTYESSPADANAVGAADVVIQNGLGYDAFMDKLEAASPNTARSVIDVGARLGYRVGYNWHLWYLPSTMPRVAALIADELARRDPAHRELFLARAHAFVRSLTPWTTLIARVRARFAGTPVATTEPLTDHFTDAAGLHVLTPATFEQAIQQGNDPSPQDVLVMRRLLSDRKVRVLLYDQQSVEPLTVQLLGLARAHHVPIVGMYETEPLSKSYQQWMLAEMSALERALSKGVSTERIL